MAIVWNCEPRAITFDLRDLFSRQPPHTEALEEFVGERLSEAGVWASPRTSDGISHVRIVELEPDAVGVCGWIYVIDDQSCHGFRLNLARQPTETLFTWSLYFDVIADSPRRERSALDTHDHADEIAWRV